MNELKGLLTPRTLFLLQYFALLSWTPNKPSLFIFSFVQFGENQEVTTMGTHQVPPFLHEKFTLLRYFAQYMDQNLTEGGETRKGTYGNGFLGVFQFFK